MFLLYHAYVYLEFLILACTIYILAPVRGVGGIDSWGSDVEDDYRISAEKDIHYSFIIR